MKPIFNPTPQQTKDPDALLDAVGDGIAAFWRTIGQHYRGDQEQIAELSLELSDTLTSEAIKAVGDIVGVSALCEECGAPMLDVMDAVFSRVCEDCLAERRRRLRRVCADGYSFRMIPASAPPAPTQRTIGHLVFSTPPSSSQACNCGADIAGATHSSWCTTQILARSDV